MNRKFFWGFLALILGGSYALVAFGQVKPEVLVQQRQAAMMLKGKYWYRHLRPTGQGKIPYDAKLVARNVGFVDALSQMPWDGFEPSTRDLPSGARAAVFTDPAKFKEAQNHYRSEVVKLVEATRTGDEAAVKAQILVVNKSCDSCHDTFRERR